ncbi:DUF2892 domain-containing protein [Psychromonas sp. RZ22]|uniref:YgaP family membrane protein n=1 Tax=Psychromonas algarum TaxID=2555643 RepID=UPI001068907D|nr:DUF2892 domain-containing protein [Psychromonas sp. RZ22]TEW54341.1 DUF2892 domain-containing protein [Psychromonas sp. RZ22]
MLNTNVGGMDRTLRIILGVVLTLVGAWSFNWWGIVGLALLFTGLMNWCPLYTSLGVSTCHKEGSTE